MKTYSSEQKPNIFVAGVSWGLGEWDGPRIIHKGIEEYFGNDGYTVFNSSKPRSSHAQVNHLLDTTLSKHYVNNDIILWIQADPILDIIKDDVPVRVGPGKLGVEKLPTLTRQLLEAGSLSNLLARQHRVTYTELNDIAVKYNTTIHCIGGSYNVSPIANEFSNLNILLTSWVNLLVGHFTEYAKTSDPDFGISHIWSVDNIILDTYNKDFAAAVSAEIIERNRNEIVFREDMFWPDGVHPNRQGHKMLYEYIKQKLDL